MLYQLYTREFIPPLGSAVIKCGSGILLYGVPRRMRMKIRSRLLRDITKEKDPRLNAVAIQTAVSIRQTQPSNMLDEYIDIPFEGMDCMCFKEWDKVLSVHYGDYMTLPPEDKRTWSHHPIILDFERNLEEIDGTEE